MLPHKKEMSPHMEGMGASLSDLHGEKWGEGINVAIFMGKCGCIEYMFDIRSTTNWCILLDFVVY